MTESDFRAITEKFKLPCAFAELILSISGHYSTSVSRFTLEPGNVQETYLCRFFFFFLLSDTPSYVSCHVLI